MFEGSRLKQQRSSLHMTQESLAEKLNVHVNTIRRWEKGEQSPDAKKLDYLATALNTTVAYLSGETQTAPQSVQLHNDPPARERSVVEKNRGTLMYTFKDGEQLVLPDTDRGYSLFEKILMQKAVMA